MTKTEQLQNLWDTRKKSYHYDWVIEWRGFGGWWAIPHECRWFGDEGEFLGYRFAQAKRTLKSFL